MNDNFEHVFSTCKILSIIHHCREANIIPSLFGSIELILIIDLPPNVWIVRAGNDLSSKRELFTGFLTPSVLFCLVRSKGINYDIIQSSSHRCSTEIYSMNWCFSRPCMKHKIRFSITKFLFSSSWSAYRLTYISLFSLLFSRNII